MIEYRTERLNPENEDDVTNILGAFGWKPVSSQEVYNESVELVGVEAKSYGAFMQGFTGKDGRIDIKQQKKITNYVTVKFARDTEIPNYQELSELNAEFERKIQVRVPQKPTVRTGIAVVAMLIILISIVLAIVESTTAEIWEICVCVIVPIVAIAVVVASWISYKRKLDFYLYIQGRLQEILERAVALSEE